MKYGKYNLLGAYGSKETAREWAGVYCKKCNVTQPPRLYSDKEEATMAWNRRAEVVHAWWKTEPDPNRKLYRQVSCSACGGWKHTMAYEHEDMHYCPNCGARMDGMCDEK